jgi:hypothetical protein
VEDDSFKGTIVVSKAKLRLKTIGDYEQPIEFKPAPKALIPEPNAGIQPMIEMIPAESNHPVESNALSEINAPAGAIPEQEGSEANLPSGIILQRDENFPGHSVSPAEVNSLPLGINIPAESNLPADVNVQE